MELTNWSSKMKKAVPELVPHEVLLENEAAVDRFVHAARVMVHLEIAENGQIVFMRLSTSLTADLDHFHDDRSEVPSLLTGLGSDAASNLARLTRASLVSVLVESSEMAE
ncbi:hypothetical protein MRX96_009761 [Rhipicephalus microplus]